MCPVPLRVLPHSLFPRTTTPFHYSLGCTHFKWMESNRTILFSVVCLFVTYLIPFSLYNTKWYHTKCTTCELILKWNTQCTFFMLFLITNGLLCLTVVFKDSKIGIRLHLPGLTPSPRGFASQSRLFPTRAKKIWLPSGELS